LCIIRALLYLTGDMDVEDWRERSSISIPWDDWIDVADFTVDFDSCLGNDLCQFIFRDDAIPILHDATAIAE
jgi:hypothetical protein